MIIHTWLADVSALREETKYDEYYQKAPKHRKDKADRLRRQEDKALSIGVWSLFEIMKKEYCLPDDVLYNFSHSGEYALCTIALGESAQKHLGCDLEQIGKAHQEVAKRYFCLEEFEKIQNAEDFYRIWVLKESFMKATRQGMKLPLNSFTFAFDEEDRPYLAKQPEQFLEQYYFKEYIVEKLPYKIAVCADLDQFAEEIKVVRL